MAQFPFAKGYATKLGVIPDIIRIRNNASKTCNDPSSLEIRLAAKEALARLGHVNTLPSKGIRILCIDGGGMKGNYLPPPTTCDRTWDIRIVLQE